MNSWVYDIEQFNNFHSIYLYNIHTEEEKCFVLHKDRDDLYDYIEWLEMMRQDKTSEMIGYNNAAFDYPIIHYIFKLIDDCVIVEETTHHIITLLKTKVDELINSGEGFSLEQQRNWTSIQERYHHVRQIDLFKIHHFDNKARSCSLKKLENNMRWNTVQSLPIPFDADVTKEQIPDIIKYNRNDVLATTELYWITRGKKEHITVQFNGLDEHYVGKDKIQFRRDIQTKFNIPCTNYSDVKIGEEINKQTYLKLTRNSWWNIKDRRTPRRIISMKDLVPSYIDYIHKPLEDLLKKVRCSDIVEGNKGFKHEFIFADNKWSFMMGGIHSEDKPREVIRDKGDRFNERDCAGMYPNKILNIGIYPEHLGKAWNDSVRYAVERRMQIKPQAKKDRTLQQESEALKLSANGGSFGKSGEPFNWQYDPLVKYTVTIQCQLDILLLADWLWYTKKIKIESANTDGLNIIYREKDHDEIEEICRRWEKLTGFTLESTEYKKVVRTSVNDYIAIKDNGEIKRKGDFEIYKELHKDMSMHIVKVAVDEYIMNRIPVGETICNGDNIYDYCIFAHIQNTSNAKYRAEYHTIQNGKKLIQPLQKDIRYYVDNTGQSSIQKYAYEGKAQGKSISLEARESCTVFNVYEKKPMKDYRIKYNYYIKEANKIIDQIYGQQTLF